jgi:hypothetical protein
MTTTAIDTTKATKTYRTWRIEEPADEKGLPVWGRRYYAEARKPPFDSETDRKHLVARLEYAIGQLRGCHVADGWSVDDAECARALKWARKHNSNSTGREWQFVLDFMHRYGIDLGWILSGDPGGMIVGLAGRSERARALGAVPCDSLTNLTPSKHPFDEVVRS